MVKVVGPMMSLEASGNFAKTVNFFYGPNGAVVRSKKKIFTPPGQIWYLNQIVFKAASARWKSFPKIQKNAWALSLLSMCDIPRDLFMGKQIESWNLSPDNDLSWPETVVPDVPWPKGKSYINDGAGTVSFYYQMSGEKPAVWKLAGFFWYSSESKTSLVNPIFLGESIAPRIVVRQIVMPSAYCWVAAWRSNGTLEPVQFVASW